MTTDLFDKPVAKTRYNGTLSQWHEGMQAFDDQTMYQLDSRELRNLSNTAELYKLMGYDKPPFPGWRKFMIAKRIGIYGDDLKQLFFKTPSHADYKS